MSRLGRGALTAFRPNPDTILPAVAPHSRGSRTSLVRAARGSYGNRLHHLQNQEERVPWTATELHVRVYRLQIHAPDTKDCPTTHCWSCLSSFFIARIMFQNMAYIILWITCSPHAYDNLPSSGWHLPDRRTCLQSLPDAVLAVVEHRLEQRQSAVERLQLARRKRHERIADGIVVVYFSHIATSVKSEIINLSTRIPDA